MPDTDVFRLSASEDRPSEARGLVERTTSLRSGDPRSRSGSDGTDLRAVSLAVAAVIAFPALASAADLTYTPPAGPVAPDPMGLLARLLVLTAVVLAVCGGLLWAARKAGRLSAAVPADATRLALAGTLALDRRTTVYLVEADGRKLAVTADAGGLKGMVLLSEPFASVLDDVPDES